VSEQFGHENLRAYQHSLGFVSWKEALIAGIERQAVVVDHLDRAAESIGKGIANGNSRRSASDRGRYFNIAIGSGLECAACLDICACKQLISGEMQIEGKRKLQGIVRMTIGLRESRSPYVKEAGAPYADPKDDEAREFFPHETLNVYKVGLELIRWLDVFLSSLEIPAGYAKELDKTTTGIVLNIAEGNGRFSSADQKRFLDIAHTSAMNAASGLDLLVAKSCVSAADIKDGKAILNKLVPLLLGMRGYLDEAES
jgi:four helix bundle protein